MKELEKRRDRMIAAYRELVSHTERLSGRSYGKCRTCGAMIEWVKTSRGKTQACIPNVGEPHIPHCGKNKWTLEKWTEVMKDIIALERKVNSVLTITVPDKKGIRTLSQDEAKELLYQWHKTPNTTTDAPW